MTNQRKEILHIAIPSVLETLFTTMTAIIDSKMVSAMGIAAISAISVTNQPRLFLLCIFFAINTTVSALVARQVGKQDRAAANRVLLTGLAAALVLGAVVSLLSVILAKPIMILCSNQPDTLANSIIYFRIVMGGLLFNIMFMTVNAAFRGCGNTRLTLVSNVASSLVNILLNYMLIGGHWGAPALGIRGAAIATVAGNVVAMTICFSFLVKSDQFVSLRFAMKEKVGPSKDCVKDMMVMWKKVVTENIFTRFGFLFTGMIAAHTGSLSMSIYSVGMHLMNVNFALGHGMQSAAVALIGRNYGAGNAEEIVSCSKQILRMGTIAAVVLSVVFILFGEPYYRFFGDEPEFIAAGIWSCVIIGIVSPIQTRQIIYNGVFQGIGAVRYTMIAAIISVTIVNPIVSFTGTVLIDGGIWGIWTGVFISQAVRMWLLQRKYQAIVREEGWV